MSDDITYSSVRLNIVVVLLLWWAFMLLLSAVVASPLVCLLRLFLLLLALLFVAPRPLCHYRDHHRSLFPLDPLRIRLDIVMADA